MSNEVDLLAPFKDGEVVTIQRTVGGKNVLMVVTIQDPCSLSAQGSPERLTARVTLNGWSRVWGVSHYADARVERQAQSINRLLAHVQAHCMNPDCRHRGVEDPIEAIVVPAAPTKFKPTYDSPLEQLRVAGLNKIAAEREGRDV